jgi:hypothetical protein
MSTSAFYVKHVFYLTLLLSWMGHCLLPSNKYAALSLINNTRLRDSARQTIESFGLRWAWFDSKRLLLDAARRGESLRLQVYNAFLRL